MSLRQWGTFHRCIRHVPLRQLLRRAWLTGKRRCVTALPERWKPRRRNQPLPLAESLPQRQFAPCDCRAEQKGADQWLRQLNCCYRLEVPFDWSLQNGKRSTHLQRLAIHYHEFLDQLDADFSRRLIVDWIRANPPWQPGCWLTNWNGYAISIRAVAWMQWLTEHAAELPPGDLQQITGSLAEQIRFLRRNLETDIRGNHLIRNLRCLMWAGRFFAAPEADAWWQAGQRLLAQELDVQLLSDGVHFELSPAYHAQVLGDLLDIASLLDDADRAALLERLTPSVQALHDLTHPDGRISLFSDGGLEMSVPPSRVSEVWQQLGGPAVTPRDRFALRSSGYYGFRHRSDCLLIDCGPSCADALPAHGHSDLLSFEWDVEQLRIVVDAGVSEYEAGPNRSRERAIHSHNTVIVGDRDPCELVGSFRTGRRAHAVCDEFRETATGVELIGHHTGYSTSSDQIVVRRHFHATPDRVVIRDRVSGRSGERCVARLLLHDACDVTAVETHGVTIRREALVIELRSTSPLAVHPAIWSPNFGQPRTTKRIEVDYGELPTDGSLELTVVRRS